VYIVFYLASFSKLSFKLVNYYRNIFATYEFLVNSLRLKNE
jgi:hypothetical protein